MRKQKNGSRHPRHEQRSLREQTPRNRLSEPAAALRSDRHIVLLHGFHPVREALRAGGRELARLHATREAADRLAAEIAAAAVPLNIVSAEDLSARLGAQAVHQGVLLEAVALEGGDISDLQQSSGIVLILDQVTDPRNVGAIIRTAAAFGIEALITTHRHSPHISGVLAKAASGALEYVALISVTNLARALDTLGKYGFLRVGLDSQGPTSLDALPI